MGHSSNRRTVPAAVAGIVVMYAVALLSGWPQAATRAAVAAEEHAVATTAIEAPPFPTVLPFVVLLAAIAVLPLIPYTAHWWDSNRNRFLVAAGLALVTLAYYAFAHGSTIESHWPAHKLVEPANGNVQLHFARTIFENAILQEYIPFITLLFSLYTICGGIRIEGDLIAHPMTNATFMAVGGILASVIGTTGAAMLLIRPLLETNRERKRVAHTIVFFIFIVCNCGGCLLPIGDPPLFIGYLLGVPFLWTLRLWPEWLFVNGLLLFIYLLLDGLWHYPHERQADIRRDVTQTRRLKFQGWQTNVPLLVGVILAVALLGPTKPFPGTDWHPWKYLREVVQLCFVAMSLVLGSEAVRKKNEFDYHAIVEVAALFFGIFVCMQPALQILNVHGDELGLHTPAHFFWATGSLSSVLDNAPTYYVFFEAAKSLPIAQGAGAVAGVAEHLLVAVSLGAVFMGSMTYIGNGPNFMVRAIAEKSGVKMPSFFGYMVYSFLILLPVFAITVWQFVM
jgi:Na+/H+ antiporter NhaD/arsenite permease-like protein